MISSKPQHLFRLRWADMKQSVAMALCAQSGTEDRIKNAADAAERNFGVTERRNPQSRAGTTRTLGAGDPALDICNGAVSLQIFGELHLKDRPRLEATLRRTKTAREAAEAVIAQAWGSYVAFVADQNGMFALGDPSGAVPLFIARSHDLQVASTRLTPAFLKAAGLTWNIDIDAVAKLLASPAAPAFLSGLSGVEIVTPGHLVSLRNATDSRPIWVPREIARRRKVLTPDVLASVLDDVLEALASNRRIGVELSGGLDSSIVFSSLASLGFRPKPFNFATSGRGGDEAHFATDVADRWDTSLYRCSSADALPCYSAFDALAQGVQPVVHGLDSVFARARQDLIDREQIDIIMTGQGGDSLFFNIPTRLVAADRCREMGIRSLFQPNTIDDARRVKGSVWSVLAATLGKRTKDDRGDHDWLTPHLLGPAAAPALRDPLPVHPWLLECADLPPAKALHLMVLAHCQVFHGDRLFAPTATMVHPLLTQPLLEIALACSTYVLQSGSRDRGLARETFKARLPLSVLSRRNKGEASDHYARAILCNRDWLLDRLLHGRLVEAGLLNPRAIEAAMSIDAIRLGTDYRAFLQYASMESWMRNWC